MAEDILFKLDLNVSVVDSRELGCSHRIDYFFLILSWGYVLKNDSRIICRCGIIRLLSEVEKWINFRNKTENVKSLKSFLQERESYG